jgi:tetratricopeptide (TPR) repeat protein
MTRDEMNKKGEQYFYTGDYKQAFDLIHKSADLGCVQAFYNLGYLYQHIDKDDINAAYWYEKAVNSGHAAAHANLGEMYCKGQGVEQDYHKAYDLFSKSVHVNAASQFNLGIMYYGGTIVEQDNNKAIMLWKKAAEQGYEPAQKALLEYFNIAWNDIKNGTSSLNKAQLNMTCEQAFVLWYGKEVLEDDFTQKFIDKALKDKKHVCPKCKSKNIWTCSGHKLKPIWLKVIAAFTTTAYGSGLGKSLAGADLIGLCEDCGRFNKL